MIEAIWFRNAHEHRNDWLRFGLMRRHRAKVLTYRELPLARCVEFGFSAAVAEHVHRHTSVLLLRDGASEVRCLVDSEDSFYWMCPLISEVDVYFCAGFNRTFFVDRAMPAPYPWQQDHEIAAYRDRAEMLIRTLGDDFPKARPFAPIGPNLAPRRAPSAVTVRLRNLRHRLGSWTSSGIYWANDLAAFEDRYRELIALRDRPLLHDVVLTDTLWGWPRHRLALHRKLGALARERRIHARLNWSPPSELDGGARAPLDPALFPLTTGEIDDYEPMLASSRLGVFATGFHWGWRNIVTLALMVGLPVYMDRPLAEPPFGWDAFVMWWNEDGGWRDLERHLDSLDEAEWRRAKAHNRAAFDRLLAPERVADYVVATALG